MYVISGRINSSLDGINEILDQRDEKALLSLAEEQVSFGAECLDFNCGTRFQTEADDMEWIIRTIQSKMDIDLCSDSPDADVQKRVLSLMKCKSPILNSTTLESERIGKMMPLVKQFKTRVIVLLHDEKGMPKSVEDRVRLLPVLKNLMKEYDMQKKDVFLDPLLFPVSVDSDNMKNVIETIREFRKDSPDWQFSTGLNNVSYGMPERELLNVTALGMFAGIGVEASIIGLSAEMAAFIRAAKYMSGEDPFGMDYISAYRDGELGIFRNTT